MNVTPDLILTNSLPRDSRRFHFEVYESTFLPNAVEARERVLIESLADQLARSVISKELKSEDRNHARFFSLDVYVLSSLQLKQVIADAFNAGVSAKAAHTAAFTQKEGLSD